MKKTKIIIPVVLLILVIGLLAVYFIYGSTLVDINSEKSISSALASEKNKPVNIIKTAKNGEFFGILYTDPADEDEGYYHFKYITKAKYYKNKYKNAGGSTDIINDPPLDMTFLIKAAAQIKR